MDQSPRVTAGLMCVPDMCPIEYTKRPKVSAASTGVGTGNDPERERPTTRLKVNVPRASAIYCFIHEFSIGITPIVSKISLLLLL